MTIEQRIAWLEAMMERWRDRRWAVFLAYQHEYQYLTWEYVRKTETSGIVTWPDEEEV